MLCLTSLTAADHCCHWSGW